MEISAYSRFPWRFWPVDFSSILQDHNDQKDYDFSLSDGPGVSAHWSWDRLKSSDHPGIEETMTTSGNEPLLEPSVQHSRRLVLASGSSARRRMLDSAGFSFDVVEANIDEEGLRKRHPEKCGRDLAVFLARRKALAVAGTRTENIVIGADQTLEIASCKHLTKARSLDQIRENLKSLSGKWHSLHSAFAIAMGDRLLISRAKTARLKFRHLSEGSIETYMSRAGDAIALCVGGYQIEAYGIHLLEAIEGDLFTIQGLPMIELLEELRRIGYGFP